MSEADREGRPWRFYIQDMIDFSEKVHFVRLMSRGIVSAHQLFNSR